MNAKTVLALIGRKNTTLAAGVLLGLLLAVQFPAMVDQMREQVAALGAGGGAHTGNLRVAVGRKGKGHPEARGDGALFYSPQTTSEAERAMKALQ